MILLQLVQALRYEKYEDPCLLKNLLIERCSESEILATNLYWYMKVECENNNIEIETWYKNCLKDFMA